MVLSLRPPLMQELGLEGALRQRLVTAPGVPGIEITSTLSSEPPLDIGEAAYWIIMEAVANVRRHANATTCLVDLRNEQPGLSVTVTDDGVGTVDSCSPGGIRRMRERVESLGGRFTVTGEPSRGTRVRASFRYAEGRP